MLIQSVTDILGPKPSEPEQKGMLGKDDFLKMLTAQLRYQNPLEPMNDHEFVAQMAQFSSLEQLQNISDILAQSTQWNMLLSQTINNTMATSLIGKIVTADISLTSVDSNGATPLRFTTTEYVLNGTITIIDAEGRIVRTLPVNNLIPGEQSINWDGRDAQGNALPAGNYEFRLALRNPQGNPVSVHGFTQGRVSGVRYIDGQAYLVVDGNLILLSHIRDVKEDGNG